MTALDPKSRGILRAAEELRVDIDIQLMGDQRSASKERAEELKTYPPLD